MRSETITYDELQTALAAAMRKAVALGVMPKHSVDEDYLRHWGNMQTILAEAFRALEMEVETRE